MNKEEIKELKDYHKRCIESIDYYYLSDSFYEIHNKIFNELEELHNKIDKAIELIEDYKFRGFKISIEQLLEILKDSNVNEKN